MSRFRLDLPIPSGAVYADTPLYLDAEFPVQCSARDPF